MSSLCFDVVEWLSYRMSHSNVQLHVNTSQQLSLFSPICRLARCMVISVIHHCHKILSSFLVSNARYSARRIGYVSVLLHHSLAPVHVSHPFAGAQRRDTGQTKDFIKRNSIVMQTDAVYTIRVIIVI